MKKIIFFAYDLNLGGIEKSLINLLNNLVDFYEITLVLEKKEGLYINDLSNKVKVIEHHVSTYKITIIRKVYNFTKRLIFSLKNKNKYDFSCAYAPYLYSAVKLSKLCSKNNAIFVHADYTYVYYDEDFFNFFNSRKINEFKKIVFVSNESEQHFIEKYPELKSKTKVINNLVNIKEIILKSEEKVNIEKNKEDITFAYVGRLNEHQKRISRLLNCFEILIEHNNNIKLWLIGSGEEHDKCQKFIDTKNLKENIKLLGSQTNPYKYLKLADYLIITSDYEGFPVVYNEANILNKYIYTTINVTDDFYKIEDGYGLIIPINVEQMAKKIENSIKTKPKVKKIDYDKLNAQRIKKIKELIDNEI